jgi:hypothetical protein
MDDELLDRVFAAAVNTVGAAGMLLHPNKQRSNSNEHQDKRTAS